MANGALAVAANNRRNPTKKRGRPPKEYNRHAFAKIIGTGRNMADMVHAVVRGLEPSLQDELLPLADVGKTTMTVLAYVARYPYAEQRAMFEELNALGSRGAKRYVECLTRPPTTVAIAQRILRWITREFPSLSRKDVALGLRVAAVALLMDESEQKDGDDLA